MAEHDELMEFWEDYLKLSPDLYFRLIASLH